MDLTNVLVVSPGEPKVLAEIPGSADMLRTLVGGPFEALECAVPGVVVLINPEACSMGLPFNFQMGHQEVDLDDPANTWWSTARDVYGTAVFVRRQRGQLTSLADAKVAAVLRCFEGADQALIVARAS